MLSVVFSSILLASCSNVFGHTCDLQAIAKKCNFDGFNQDVVILKEALTDHREDCKFNISYETIKDYIQCVPEVLFRVDMVCGNAHAYILCTQRLLESCSPAWASICMLPSIAKEYYRMQHIHDSVWSYQIPTVNDPCQRMVDKTFEIVNAANIDDPRCTQLNLPPDIVMDSSTLIVGTQNCSPSQLIYQQCKWNLYVGASANFMMSYFQVQMSRLKRMWCVRPNMDYIFGWANANCDRPTYYALQYACYTAAQALNCIEKNLEATCNRILHPCMMPALGIELLEHHSNESQLILHCKTLVEETAALVKKGTTYRKYFMDSRVNTTDLIANYFLGQTENRCSATPVPEAKTGVTFSVMEANLEMDTPKPED